MKTTNTKAAEFSTATKLIGLIFLAAIAVPYVELTLPRFEGVAVAVAVAVVGYLILPALSKAACTKFIGSEIDAPAPAVYAHTRITSILTILILAAVIAAIASYTVPWSHAIIPPVAHKG